MDRDGLSEHRQVIKRQLSVVDTFGVLAVTNTMTRNFERLTHGIEMKADYSWRQSHGRNATLRSQASHRRFADLQNRGYLFGS